MNKIILLVLTFFLLTGCAKKFAPLYQDAQTHFAEGKYIEAIDDINLALPFWKDADGQEQKAQAYQLLGTSYHQIKKIDKAAEAYSKAIELSTSTFESAYRLGVIYLTSNQYAPAVKTFKDALRMKKDDPYTLLQLGHSYFSQNNFEEARVAYQRVIDASPGVKDALESLKLIDDKLKNVRKRTVVPRRQRGQMKIKKHRKRK